MQIGVRTTTFRGSGPTHTVRELPIAPHFTHPGITLPYEYNFGDGWEHSTDAGGDRGAPGRPEVSGLRRRGASVPAGRLRRPVRLRRRPRRDPRPRPREHESVLAWLGGRFDPERFDPSRVKFDDPRQRWKRAFAPPPPARARRGAALAVEGGVDVDREDAIRRIYDETR